MASVDQSLLGTFQKHIEDMRNLSLCKICIKPFYEPFILGCGHTYCYSCLASWFGGAQGRRKSRNCPDCRAVVTATPSPNYLLRDLVHMFIGRVELLPEDETFEEHQQAKEEEAALLAADRAGPGLFKGAFLRRGHPFLHLGRGVPDEGDNVVRCPECHWELEHGECLQCGFREFEAGGISTDSSDDDSDIMSLHTIETEYDSEGIEIPRLDGRRTIGQLIYDGVWPGDDGLGTYESDDDDDEDDDDDMDGFIADEDDGIDEDDDHDSQATMTDAHHQAFHDAIHRAAHHRHHHIEIDLRSDDGIPTDDNDTQPMNYDDQSDVATNYDEPTEDSDQEDDIRPSQRSSRTAPRTVRRTVISDDDDDDDDDGEDDSSSGSEDTSQESESSDGSDQDDSDDGEDGAGQGASETTGEHDTEAGDSLSDESDGTAIQPAQSVARRRQHLQSMRARRHDAFGIKPDDGPDMSNETLRRVGMAIFRNMRRRNDANNNHQVRGLQSN